MPSPKKKKTYLGITAIACAAIASITINAVVLTTLFVCIISSDSWHSYPATRTDTAVCTSCRHGFTQIEYRQRLLLAPTRRGLSRWSLVQSNGYRKVVRM